MIFPLIFLVISFVFSVKEEDNKSPLILTKAILARQKANFLFKKLKEKVLQNKKGSIADIDMSKITTEKQDQIEKLKKLREEQTNKILK